MEIKFKKSLSEYKYLVMFDLASKITGVCLWDIHNATPIKTDILKVTGKHELPVEELYELINNYFAELNKSGILLEEVLVYKEAMPTQLRGGSSTVQTFLALARSHAALDLFTYHNNIDIYDYTGVYPISTHAYLKKINGWDNKHSVEKTDINNYVKEKYGFEKISFDESDAIFLAKTFIESKWDKDINEQIKEIKRHRKTLKLEYAIKACNNEISRLERLKTV